MKRLLISCAAFLSALATPAVADDMIVALTPFAASPETARRDAVQLLQFLTQEIEPGESALLLDAHAANAICEFVVPDKPAYKHEKTKLAYNAPCISTLLKRAEKATQSAPVAGSIDLPDLLRFIGGNYPAVRETDVLIFGSPLFDDPREPSVSMAYGHVPGDGHLNAPASASPYSAVSPTLLAHLRVHLVAPDAGWAVNREHEFFVRRLWTLFIEKQGGSLVTFTNDPQTAFARIRAEGASSSGEFQNADETKLEMIPIRRDTGARTPIHQRPLAQTPPSIAERRAASNVEIGITWDCARCDLDLYARPWRGAEVLHWNHTNSPEGQFFKDFRHSPQITKGLETIEFIAPLDIDRLIIAVNLYQGSPPAGVASGEIRISIGERTYAAPFSLPASSGNKGEGAAALFASGSPSSSPGWIVIDAASVLGLN